MKKTKIFLILSFFFSIALFLNVFNIGIGLPSREQAKLVFGNRETVNQLSPAMKSLREQVYENYKEQTGLELMKFYAPTNLKTSLILNGSAKKVEERKIHALRSVLLQTRWPDEQKTLVSISELKSGKLNPHIFHYGGFYLYSCGLSLKISEIFGAVKLTRDVSYYLKNTEEAMKLYAIPKIMGGFLGALSVFFIFLAGYRFSNLKTGLLSAAFMAVVPSLGAESHSLKPFSFFLPFFILSLYFSLNILKQKTGETKSFFLSGLFSGLSAGAMIFSGISLLFPVAACFLSEYKKEKKVILKGLLAAVAGFSAAFLATNPFYLTDLSEVITEIKHLSSVQPFVFSPGHMVHYSIFEFHKILGFPLYFLTLAGTARALLRRNREDLLLLSVFFSFYFYTSNAHWDAPHYSMLLVPLSIILSSEVIFAAWGKINRRAFLKIGTAVVWVLTFLNSVYYLFTLSGNQMNLIETGKWINDSIPKGSAINSSAYPYFGFKSYPPFELLEYSINDKKNADYFIINNVNHEMQSIGMSYKDANLDSNELKKNYLMIKEFKRKKNFLDNFYDNDLYILLEQDFRIYRRIFKQ